MLGAFVGFGVCQLFTVIPPKSKLNAKQRLNELKYRPEVPD